MGIFQPAMSSEYAQTQTLREAWKNSEVHNRGCHTGYQAANCFEALKSGCVMNGGSGVTCLFGISPRIRIPICGPRESYPVHPVIGGSMVFSPPKNIF